MSKPLYIDFDDTLCAMSDVQPGYKMGPTMPGALSAVNELIRRGYKPTVFTVRAQTMAGTKAVMDWLKYFGFPDMPVTAIKGNADILDNRAIHFTSWSNALEQLRG